jgi:hypothetical protein
MSDLSKALKRLRIRFSNAQVDTLTTIISAATLAELKALAEYIARRIAALKPPANGQQ